MADSSYLAARVAFIGLGTMGRPMAHRVAGGAFSLVVVPHRSRSAADELASVGARIAATPAEAAHGADIIVTMLPAISDVEDVLFGPSGIIGTASAGCLVIDMSTIGPSSARGVAARLTQAGISFLDAPVSGGPAKAADGTLTIMVGGSPEDVERARPLLSTMGSTLFHAGGTGAGQVAKACNNLLVGVVMAANAEALALAQAAGLDPAVAREIILASSGANWQLEHIVPRTLLKGDFSPIFSLRLLGKDLAIAAGMAHGSGVPLFMGGLAQQLYRLAASIDPEADFSSVARIYGPVPDSGRLRGASAEVVS